MAKEPQSSKARKKRLEYVEPIGLRVLVRKDEPKKETKGGIRLPLITTKICPCGSTTKFCSIPGMRFRSISSQTIICLSCQLKTSWPFFATMLPVTDN